LRRFGQSALLVVSPSLAYASVCRIATFSTAVTLLVAVCQVTGLV